MEAAEAMRRARHAVPRPPYRSSTGYGYSFSSALKARGLKLEALSLAPRILRLYCCFPMSDSNETYPTSPGARTQSPAANNAERSGDNLAATLVSALPIALSADI